MDAVVRMPWTWARYQAEAQIGSGQGHLIQIETVVVSWVLGVCVLDTGELCVRDLLEPGRYLLTTSKASHSSESTGSLKDVCNIQRELKYSGA